MDLIYTKSGQLSLEIIDLPELTNGIQMTFKQNLISEAEYNETKQDVAATKQQTFDEIICDLSLLQTELSEVQPEYSATLNSETKELMLLDIHDSKEGLDALFNEEPIKFKINDFKDKYANLIKKFKIGGIQNPVCITEQYKDANKPGGIPVQIYTDKDDQSKRVTIGLDCIDGSLFSIFVWEA